MVIPVNSVLSEGGGDKMFGFVIGIKILEPSTAENE